MGRTPGARNEGYFERRKELLESLVPPLLEHGPAALSLRRMAEEVHASVTTLRHYFGDRTGVLVAIYEHLHESARPYLDASVRRDSDDPVAELLRFLRGLTMAWRAYQVGRMHVLGLGEGFTDARLGMAYVNDLLEPTVQTAERLLADLDDHGLLEIPDTRAAALGLVSPAVVALLHQDPLNGSQCRPLDVDAFLERLVEGFVHGHAPRSGDAARAASESPEQSARTRPGGDS